MKPEQWQTLVDVVNGENAELPVAFIIDSPWLPGWCGHSILDYYGSDELWMDCNLEAIRTFSEVIFLPGFWSEFGMCTEPSAFGCRPLWNEHDLPFAEPVAADAEDMESLEMPDPRKHGLPPLMLGRLERMQPRIEDAGHVLKFAVARGPLNIASFVRGSTELMMDLKTQPDAARAMLRTITEFLVDWLQLQKEAFPTIEGILLLDDVVGFLSEDDFLEWGKPYLEQAFGAFDAEVRFFHNDAEGTQSAPHLSDAGVNLFNFSSDHGLSEMRELVGDDVALLGNLPPRDVLANGSPDEVREGVREMFEDMPDGRVLPSCGGGMPPEVPTENIRAFLDAVDKHKEGHA